MVKRPQIYQLLGLAPESLELAPACTWLISAPLMVMVMVMMMICDDDDDDDGPTTYYHIYYLLHTLHLACQPLAIMGVPPRPEICVHCDAAYCRHRRGHVVPPCGQGLDHICVHALICTHAHLWAMLAHDAHMARAVQGGIGPGRPGPYSLM